MADHGQMGAFEIVASGLQSKPPKQPEQYRQGECLADCLYTVTDASRTKR